MCRRSRLQPAVEAVQSEHEEEGAGARHVRLFFALGREEPGCAAEDGDYDEADEGCPAGGRVSAGGIEAERGEERYPFAMAV